jgi:hypothetical protein
MMKIPCSEDLRIVVILKIGMIKNASSRKMWVDLMSHGYKRPGSCLARKEDAHLPIHLNTTRVLPQQEKTILEPNTLIRYHQKLTFIIMKCQGAIAFLHFIFGLATALPPGQVCYLFWRGGCWSRIVFKLTTVQSSEGALKRDPDVNARDDCRVPSGCVNMDPEGCEVACYKRETNVNASD